MLFVEENALNYVQRNWNCLQVAHFEFAFYYLIMMVPGILVSNVFMYSHCMLKNLGPFSITVHLLGGCLVILILYLIAYGLISFYKFTWIIQNWVDSEPKF